MNIHQLCLADYDKLSNIPIVNQDLSASGFTGAADTYYRHTGATDDIYTKGLLYYYNGTTYSQVALVTSSQLTINDNVATIKSLIAKHFTGELTIVAMFASCTNFEGQSVNTPMFLSRYVDTSNWTLRVITDGSVSDPTTTAAETIYTLSSYDASTTSFTAAKATRTYNSDNTVAHTFTAAQTVSGDKLTIVYIV